MKIGVKVGPTDWESTFEQITPECVEIWFRLDWADRYDRLINYLTQQHIPFGLHYWDAIEGKYFPSFLSARDGLAEKTFTSLCRTLELAGHWQAHYVNFHPESYRVSLLDLDKHIIRTLDQEKPIDRDAGFAQLMRFMPRIRQFALERNVVPFIETVPRFLPSDFDYEGRSNVVPMQAEGMETAKYFELAKAGYPICLDIGHTIAQQISEDRQFLFTYVLDTALQLRDAVGLIHVTTNLPPFNGVDSHQGVTEQDFASGVLPDREQMKSLLAVFRATDTWLVPEPQMNAKVQNFRALEKLVGELGNAN